MPEDLAYLQEAHAAGVLVPMIGAGVAAAAASLPAWPALLDKGLRYAVDHGGISAHDPRIDNARNERTAGRLTLAFDILQELLGVIDDPMLADNYRAFLAEVFAQPKVHSTELLDALRFLQPQKIMTTNYDLLLEDHNVCGGSGVTWKQPAEIRRIFRLGQGVVHLHGRWDRAASVILSQNDYNRIGADRPAKAIAEAIFHSGVLMFVGTSLDGSCDPHLGDLLAAFESLSDPAAGEPAPHVMLLRGPLDGQQIVRLQKQGIRAVSYGIDYGDLPRFLNSIADTGQVQIRTRLVDQLLASVASASSLDDALREVGRWIESEVFTGRAVRVAFSKKEQEPGGGHMLRQRAVFPLNSSRNPHNYPLSIAAWALLEGRVIAWPRDKARHVDFAWLERIRKLSRVEERLASPEMDVSPEVIKYLDLAAVRTKFADRTLVLNDFYQDWASDQPHTPYLQFLSVPVPMLEHAGNRDEIPEYGVFNIDTADPSPLLDRRVNELLRLASAVAVLAFKLFPELSGSPTIPASSDAGLPSPSVTAGSTTGTAPISRSSRLFGRKGR